VLIIGSDYHPSVQQIAWLDSETGEYGERRLAHCGEAEQFYRELKQQGASVRVGIEATGQSGWFERLLSELNFELWIGDPAQIAAKRMRKKKNDREDARLLRKLMLEDNFPRIWVPDPDNRDLRQLVLASASAGADAHQGNEPAPGYRHERRHTTQARTVDAVGASAVRSVAVTKLDQSPAGIARATRSL
jgi:hypothetical protein